MMEKQIVVNRIRTPDGTILTSRHVHDYVTYIDANSEEYMVDGGTDYLRRNVCKAPHEEISLYVDGSMPELREAFTWGTYGVDGDQPLTWVKLKDMEIDHILNVLKIQTLEAWRRELFERELRHRGYL